MTRLRSLLLTAAVALLAAVLLALVLRGRAATWMTLDAPGSARPGTMFEATVHLAAPEAEAGSFITFDLHGRDRANDPVGYVVGGQPQRIEPDKQAYSFSLPIPDSDDLKSVHAVIYLSRTAQWRSRYRVGRSIPLAVVRSSETIGAGDLRTYDATDEPPIEVPHPPLHRGLVAAGWLVCALLAWRRRALAGSHGSPRWLPLVFVLFAALEASDVLGQIAEAARIVARARGWYDERRGLQLLATFAIVCGMAALATLAVRRSRARTSAAILLGSALFLTIEAAGTLSLHELDRVLAMPLGPVVVDTAVRGLAAALVLGGLLSGELKQT